jgi:hypothetical protein
MRQNLEHVTARLLPIGYINRFHRRRILMRLAKNDITLTKLLNSSTAPFVPGTIESADDVEPETFAASECTEAVSDELADYGAMSDC